MFYISAPEIQALIHNQLYHNFVEKMIDLDHGHLVEELANEDEFVPTDMATGRSTGFCFTVAAEQTISNKKVAVKKAQGTIYELSYLNQLSLYKALTLIGYLFYFFD